MALNQETIAARVYVVGKDPLVARTLTRLFELDEDIEVLGEASSVKAAPLAEMRPGVVVLDEASGTLDARRAQAHLRRVAPDSRLCLLDTLRDLTVGEIIETVRQMAPAAGSRHLRAVDAPFERDALAGLSERELEVVRLVAEGLSNKEISGRLNLSDKTVKNHISHILAKMSLTARTQVAVYAIRAGLV